MRHLICKSCGRRYDYDKENFCPKCGSYNQPEAVSSTRLEREQLARFGDGENSPPRRTAPVRETPPAAAPKASGRSKRPGLAIVVAIMAVSALSAIPLNLGSGSSHSLNRALDDFIASRVDGLSEQSYGLEETFSLNDVEITVDDVWWVDLSGNPRAAREGFCCLAVEVWITGGTRRDDLRIEDPALVLEDGTAVRPEDDSSLHQKLAANGLYPVNLRDYQWEDPLYGQFIFYLPEDATGRAELVFQEYGTSGRQIGTRTVSVPLPGREEV